jgi:hypothetical protein
MQLQVQNGHCRWSLLCKNPPSRAIGIPYLALRRTATTRTERPPTAVNVSLKQWHVARCAAKAYLAGMHWMLYAQQWTVHALRPPTGSCRASTGSTSPRQHHCTYRGEGAASAKRDMPSSTSTTRQPSETQNNTRNPYHMHSSAKQAQPSSDMTIKLPPPFLLMVQAHPYDTVPHTLPPCCATV